MARALFSAEQVHEAADALSAEGKEATALALLSRLGGGSLTTIYKHLISWREARQQQSSYSTQNTIPETVQAAFATALGRAWSAAASEAAKEIAIAKEKAATEVQTATKQFDEAMQAIERMEEQADQDATKIEGLTDRLAQTEAALQESETEKAGLKATSDQLRNQVKTLETELERVHKDFDSLRDDSRIEKEKVDLQLQQLEQELQSSRKEKELAGQETAQFRGQVEVLQSHNRELLARIS